MESQSQHQMVVEQTYSNGSQEWYCPTCGRRFIMQWPPNYKRIILEAGDTQATHSGGMGGLIMGKADVEAADPGMENALPGESLDMPNEGDDADDPYLSPFSSWIDGKEI